MNSLFALEHFSRDAFRVKRTYIDITEDLIAGILLGQIVYWNLPNENGNSKLKVVKDGQLWLAKGRTDWHEEIRITPKQFDRALKILKDKGLVETQLFRFSGSPTVHIKLNIETLETLIQRFLPKGQNPITPNGNMEIDQTVKTLTEITAKTTTQKKDSRPQQAADTKKASKVYEEDSDAFLLADFFYRQILKNDPEHKKPNLQKWADVIRKILELDGRDRVEVKQIIKFVQTDDFEMVNVLSPDKLRKRYDNLKLKMYKANGASQNQAGGPSNGFDDFLQAGGQ